MPKDSPLRGAEADDVALGGAVLPPVKFGRAGGPGWIRTSDRTVMSRLL